ncbi:MAG: hypothetical protein IPH88_06945 [Bacteroidales bacterium]|nr:hypothetical protein [Bacteroidales bacterium]
MTEIKITRISFSTVVLVFLMLIHDVNAIYGGIQMILNPGLTPMDLNPTIFGNGPFMDFLFPGILLFILFGLFPLLATFGLFYRFMNPWVNFVNVFHDQYFGWTYSMYTGVMLFFWILIQLLTVGYTHYSQALYAVLGMLIVLVGLSQANIQYYQLLDDPAVEV